MIDDDISRLLARFDLPSVRSSRLLTGGANNRVYKLSFDHRDPLILKRYFQHPQDSRQRLHSEFSFIEYCWNLGLRCVPQPIHADPSVNAAIYSFLPGCSISEDEITESLIQEMIDFFLSINQRPIKTLAPASESCFSLQEHIETIDKRINRLISCEDSELTQFLHDHLLPPWKKTKKTIITAPDHTLSSEERCISPSDFGFHNALLLQNDHLAFIDFEYAGWDDPAKTVCDFFCQPRIPIPGQFFQSISEQFSSVCALPKKTIERIRLLFPAYRIKWCCIILNSFSLIGQTRRGFAYTKESSEEQLKKASQLLTQDLPWHT